MNRYRVDIVFSGALDYKIWATDVEMAKQKAMEIWLKEGMNENCIEIMTARPFIVENLITGEVEYEENM